MKHSVGLDVSVKETAICIIDEGGKVVRETKAATEPQAVIAFLSSAGLEPVSLPSSVALRLFGQAD